MNYFEPGYKRTIGGIEVNNVKSYAADKKYIVVKKVDGEWWFEAADNSVETASRIVSELSAFGTETRILNNSEVMTA